MGRYLLFIITLFSTVTFSCKSANMIPKEPIQSGVFRWADHPVKQGDQRESRMIFEGSSHHFEYLRIHSTTQFPGAAASTAHANEEHEECIIVKEGTMKVNFDGESKIIGPKGVILIMPQQMHSLQNVGDDNLTYYVLKYKSKKPMNLDRASLAGGSMIIHSDSLTLELS